MILSSGLIAFNLYQLSMPADLGVVYCREAGIEADGQEDQCRLEEAYDCARSIRGTLAEREGLPSLRQLQQEVLLLLES